MLGRPRLIRLRTSDNHETPEWYIPTPDGADVPVKMPRSTQGLWRTGAGRPYYNIGRKPRGAGTRVIVGKNTNPAKHEAVASILEIIPAAVQDDEEVTLWPVAIDQWRRLSYRWSDMTIYPLPMHFAHKMEEYARVIASWLLPDALQHVLDDNDDDGDDVDDGDVGAEAVRVATQPALALDQVAQDGGPWRTSAALEWVNGCAALLPGFAGQAQPAALGTDPSHELAAVLSIGGTIPTVANWRRGICARCFGAMSAGSAAGEQNRWRAEGGSLPPLHHRPMAGLRARDPTR
jgi:hypothetical protein